jgi:hypothetical protein
MAKTEEKKKGKEPEFHIRGQGGLSLAAWKNEGEGKNGKVTFYSFTAQRAYKDGDSWANTESFRVRDLLPLSKMLEKAYDKATEKKEKDEDED